MKKLKLELFVILLIVSGIACSRHTVPSGDVDRRPVKYDTAAFDFFYVEAVKQKLMGNAGDAMAYLDKCLKLNPGSDGVYYQMAQIVLGNGDLASGKRYLMKAVSIDTNNVYYTVMLAGVYFQERNLDSATIWYEKAAKNNPERENLQITLGNLYSEQGKYDKAVSVFDALDRKYGVNQNSTVQAVKNLMMAKRFDEAENKAKELIVLFPDEVLYMGLLAEIYRGKGETDKAREEYDSLIEKNPDDPQAQLSLCDFLLEQKSYDELFRLINTVSLNGNIRREDKIALFLKLIENEDIISGYSDQLVMAVMVLEANYKDDDIINMLRPELLIREKNLEEAKSRLEEIVAEKNSNYYAWEKLLLVYLETKDYAKLYSQGEVCATMFNRSFLAKILYANGAVENGKYDVALEELRKAEILAADNKDSLLQVQTMRADVYYKMKDYQKAFETFDKILKSDKDDLTVLNNYAYYLSEQDLNLKEAEKMAKEVIEKEPENTTYLDTYGWVLYKRGKFKEAAQVFQKIISSGETDDAVWYEHYGYILKKMKKCNEAVEKWKYAIKLDSTRTKLENEIQNCGK